MDEFLNRMDFLTNTFKIEDTKARKIVKSLNGKEFNVYAQIVRVESKNPIEKGKRFVELFDGWMSDKKQKTNREVILEILKESRDNEDVQMGSTGAELARRGVVFVEANLMRLPLCKLGRTRSASGIKYEGIDKHGNPFKWNVLPSVEYGDMGSFEQDIIFAIFDMASQRMLQNKGEIPKEIWFTTEQLCEFAGKTPIGDTIYRAEEALERIRASKIITENIFRIKGEDYTFNGELELLKIVFIARNSTGGKREKLNRVGLGETITGNLKNKYRYRLNPDYVRELTVPLAKKLYAFLTYSWVSSKGKVAHYNYSTLCNEIPLEAKTEFKRATIHLRPALKQLKKGKFIKDYSWKKIKRYGEREEWLLNIKPGERFDVEYAQNKLKITGAEKVTEIAGS